MISNKKQYRQFCRTEKNISLFCRPWWLDAVCGSRNWDVALLEKNNSLIASMPYYKVKQKLFHVIKMPLLTQTMGPFIKYPPGQKYSKKISFEKKIMNELIKQLPRCSVFKQKFHYQISNWLPFFWQGYSQTTLYTYIIKKDISWNDLEQNFNSNVKRKIKKAKQSAISVTAANDPELFYSLNRKSFYRKKKKIPYSLKFIQNLYKACKTNQAVKILYAQNKNNKKTAAAFLVYDNNSVYYLMGGIDPDYNYPGAMDLVHLQGIKFALQSGRNYNFEGSMVENIENYFRSFGAVQQPYFLITKINSKIYKTLLFIKEISKKIDV